MIAKCRPLPYYRIDKNIYILSHVTDHVCAQFFFIAFMHSLRGKKSLRSDLAPSVTLLHYLLSLFLSL